MSKVFIGVNLKNDDTATEIISELRNILGYYNFVIESIKVLDLETLEFEDFDLGYVINSGVAIENFSIGNGAYLKELESVKDDADFINKTVITDNSIYLRMNKDKEWVCNGSTDDCAVFLSGKYISISDEYSNVLISSYDNNYKLYVDLKSLCIRIDIYEHTICGFDIGISKKEITILVDELEYKIKCLIKDDGGYIDANCIAGILDLDRAGLKKRCSTIIFKTGIKHVIISLSSDANYDIVIPPSVEDIEIFNGYHIYKGGSCFINLFIPNINKEKLVKGKLIHGSYKFRRGVAFNYEYEVKFLSDRNFVINTY